MRAAFVGVALAATAVIAVTTTGVVRAVVGAGATGGGGSSVCSPGGASGWVIARRDEQGHRDAAALEAESKAIVAAIISFGKQRQLPPRAWQVAIQAGKTESGLRNLNYGDRDSVGIFQMRTSMGWGTPQQLQDIPYQINKFFDVLLEVPNWELKRPGDAAQAVERSAFPDRYHRWEAMAALLVSELGGLDPGQLNAPCTQLPANEVAARAIQAALKEQGKPYVWGAEGPDSFDCSGLMQWAYRAVGVDLPRTSREQWKAGGWVPVKEALPGDLVFWAKSTTDAQTIHHVAMYLGNNQIVEAQQTGVPVHTRELKWTEGELMAFAVRPAPGKVTV